MDRQHFTRMKKDPLYKPAVNFILALRALGVPLSAFVTNDWHSNTRPSVYLDMRGMKKTGFPLDYSKWQRGTRCGFGEKNLRRCERLDLRGIALALRWHKKTIGS